MNTDNSAEVMENKKIDRQLIITIGREFGSAGHMIGEQLAGRLGISFYDRRILDELGKEIHLDESEISRYDEKPKSRFFSRTVNGYSNSIEDILFELQCKHMRSKMEAGESFVLVGRCGEKVFEDFEGLISIFVLGDKEEKIARVMEVYNLNSDEAYEKMRRHDKKRKAYHNSRCEGKWGDSRTYDLCVNSTRLGVKATVDMLERYVYRRLSLMNH